MSILITGACGQIGISLIEHLATQGHDIIATDLDIDRVEKLGIKNVECFESDIRVSDTLNNHLVQKTRILIHLAGSKVTEFDSGEELFQINTIGTVNILESLPRNITRIIFPSTMSVYGAVQTNPVTEEFPENPGNLYGASKLSSEKLCEIYARENGIEFISLRITGVYGGCLTDNAISSFIRKAINNDDIIIDCGKDTYRDYLYITDCVHAITAAVTTKKQGVFNIGSGVGIPVHKVAEKVINFSESKSKLIFPQKKVQPTFSFVYDINKAKQLPFIPQTSIDLGLKNFINNEIQK